MDNVGKFTNTFEEYLKVERQHFDLFLQTFKILDKKFDENEYSLLKTLWTNTCLINQIYEAIDELLFLKKMNETLRLLIIGDFLFSLSSFDLNDPSALVLKTTRNVYISKIQTRSIINIIFECDYTKYVDLHKKLLIALRLNNTIKRDQIRVFKDKKWDTTIYISLENSKFF